MEATIKDFRTTRTKLLGQLTQRCCTEELSGPQDRSSIGLFLHHVRVFVVRNDLAAIRELLLANCTRSALLSDLPIEQLPHLGWRPKFPVSLG